MSSRQTYANGMEIASDADRRNKVNSRHLKYQCTVRFARVRQDFLNNRTVPEGFTVKYQGRIYRAGERLFPELPAGQTAPDEPAAEAVDVAAAAVAAEGPGRGTSHV